MDQLNNSLQDLEKIQEHLRHYSLEVHPLLQSVSGQKVSGQAEFAVIYNLLCSLNQSMIKELDSMALHLHASNHPPDSNLLLEKLSTREQEVLTLLAKGCSYNEVAEMMGCTTSTTQTYVKRIYKKLKVHSRSEAIFEAASLGIINL